MIKVKKVENINREELMELEDGNNCKHQDFKWYHPLVKGERLKHHEELIVYGKMFCEFNREYMEAPVPYASTCITKDEKLTGVLTKNTQHGQTLYISENKGKFKKVALPKGKFGISFGGFIFVTLNNKIFLFYRNGMELCEFNGKDFNERISLADMDWYNKEGRCVTDMKYLNGNFIVYNTETKEGFEVTDD